MASFYEDNEDLRFYVEQYVDWQSLLDATELNPDSDDAFSDLDEAAEFYRSVLELVGEFSAEEIAPRWKELDTQHPRLEDGFAHDGPAMAEIFEQLGALELHGMCLPRELGGMNCPFLLFNLTAELLARADVSVAAHNGFHGGMALAMLLYSGLEGSTRFDPEEKAIVETRFADEIAEIVAGEAWGSMDITEPGAGSDMAALRTKGVLGEDGIWRVTGQKIFITSGHGKYHFVIARTEKDEGEEGDAFSGLKGLSMFLVPTWSEDEQGQRVLLASFDSLEEKLGHHGSATVAISFEDTPAHLLGKRGEGFKLMLQMMNSARVAVGFESLGVAECSWRMARDYAAERESMGKTIDRHEMIADYLEEMQTDIQAMRALAVQSAFHEEMARKLELKERFKVYDSHEERERVVADRKRHQRRARRYTPLLKYLAAEKAVEIAQRGIQIHGGYGYSSEYGAEKLLRDAMVLPIYEGTSQIQALMVMKDSLMGILRDPKAHFERAAKARWRGRAARDPLDRRVARLESLSHRALQHLMARLAGKKLGELRELPLREWKELFKTWDPKRDFALAMLHAERLTSILCDVAVCGILLRQVRQHPQRAELLERYLERAEPRCACLHQQITTTGARLLATLEEPEQDEAAVS